MVFGPSHDPGAILDGLWKRVPPWATRFPSWAVWPLWFIVLLLVTIGPFVAFYLVLRLTLDLLASFAAMSICISLGLHLNDGLHRRRTHDDLADLYAARIKGWLTEDEFESAKDRVNARRAFMGSSRRRAWGAVRIFDLLTTALFGLLVLRTLVQALEGLPR